MIDAAGNTISVGDVVAGTDGGPTGVVLFEVTDLTPQKVRILRLDGAAVKGKSSSGTSRPAGRSKTMFPHQVVKVLTPLVAVHGSLVTEDEATLDANVRNLIQTWTQDEQEYLNTWGQHMPCSLASCIEHLETTLSSR